MNAPGRQRLSNRRRQWTETISWNNLTFQVSIGFDDHGRAREVFAAGVKTGSNFESLLDDTCILLSYLLQMEIKASALARSLGAKDNPSVTPAGALLLQIIKLENDYGLAHPAQAAAP